MKVQAGRSKADLKSDRYDAFPKVLPRTALHRDPVLFWFVTQRSCRKRVMSDSSVSFRYFSVRDSVSDFATRQEPNNGAFHAFLPPSLQYNSNLLSM